MNATRLHYVRGGTGPTVLLVHGWPFSWLEWRDTLPLLAAAGFSAVAPDLRGIGDSAKPEDGHHKRDTAEDLHQFVQHLGIDHVSVVGTDIGTMVVHAYATAYPTEVDHLVLTEAMLPGFGSEPVIDLTDGGSWHFGFHAQVDLAEMLTFGHEAAYLGGMWAVMSNGGLTADDRAELLRAYQSPGRMRGGFKHYATLLEDGQANRQAATTSLPMPVLVLNGDAGLPQGPLLDGVRQFASDVRADIVPNSAQTIGADNLVWLAARLTRFFRTDK